MKVLVYVILLLLSNGVMAQKEVEVEANFDGRPRCVGGVGMCAVEPLNKGNAALWLGNNELVLKVFRDKIALEKETKILGKELKEVGTDIYIMKEPFQLSENLRTALNLSKETTIPAGQYPVTISKNYVEITFRIEMK